MLLPLLATLTVAADPVPASQEQAPDLATLVPASALFAGIGEDLGALRERGRQNSWWRLLQDPAFEQMLAHVRGSEAYRQAREELDEEPLETLCSVGAMLEDVVFYVELPNGFAGDLGDTFGKQVRGTLAVRHATDAESVAALDRMLAAGEAELEPVAQDASSGFELFDGDDATLLRGDGLLVLEIGGGADAFAAGEQAAARHGRVAALARRMRGDDVAAVTSGDSLVSLPAYRRSRADADHPVELFFDVGHVMEAVTYDLDVPHDVVPMLEEMGLPDMGHYHMSLDVGTGENIDSFAQLELGVGSVFDRLLAYTRELDTGLLERIPSEAISITLFAYDLGGAYEELGAMVEEFDYADGQAKAAFDFGVMSAEATLGYTLDELFGLFTGQFALYTTPVDLEQEDEGVAAMLEMAGLGSMPADVYVLELTDGELAVEMIDELLQASGFSGERRTEEVGDVTLNQLVMGDMPMLAWAVNGDLLHVSNFAGGVRPALELRTAEGSSAATSEVYAGFDQLAAGALTASITDSAALAEQLLGMLPTFGFLMSAEDPAMEGLLSTMPWPDPSIVPAYFGGRSQTRTLRVGSTLEFHTTTR